MLEISQAAGADLVAGMDRLRLTRAQREAEVGS